MEKAQQQLQGHFFGYEEEKAKLPERLEVASEIIKSFGTAGLENTMTAFNGK